MTTVEPVTRRRALREEIAALVDLDPELLPDGLRLSDAGMDSLTLMRVHTWLDAHDVSIDAAAYGEPVTIGEVLTLLEHATTPGVSISVAARSATIHNGLLDSAVPTRPVDPLAPVLRTRSMVLTPVKPDDLGFLYQLATGAETSFRWRYRGAPPSLERYAENLWPQVLVQYVVRRVRDNEPVGHILAYGVESTMRFAYIGAVFVPTVAGTGLAAQAVSTFMRYLFHIMPLKKLYLQIPGYNFGQLSSGEGTQFQIEGVLRDHLWYGGRTWDEYICAVYAEQFSGPEGGGASQP
jgi:RimJ/RimL family protein N-acetyltransferase/aryl carrier-like protein